MPYRLVCLGLLVASGAFPETSSRPDLDKLRQLVAAGALPQARLTEAEQQIADSDDDAVLRQTLYGPVDPARLDEKEITSMLAAAERRLDRQQVRIARLRKLVDSGVLARGELLPLESELDGRRLTVELARSRAGILRETAQLIQAEKAAAEVPPTPDPLASNHSLIERYDGDGNFRDDDLRQVTLAFEKQFGKPLPVSARGETELHRALGLDHRGRVDVALNPDAVEGIWLRRFLVNRELPYFAFRAAVAGQATAPHIHLGPGSTRIRSAD